MSDCETSVIWHGNTLVDEHVGFPFVAYIADIFMCIYIQMSYTVIQLLYNLHVHQFFHGWLHLMNIHWLK